MASKKTKRKKRVGSRRKKTSPRAIDVEVVDLTAKRVEKLTGEFEELARNMTSALDAQVAEIVASYRAWERDNPDLRLRPHHKMEMVRWGFIGPAGFTRCHQTFREPHQADLSLDAMIASPLDEDLDATERAMCPAMEARRCQGIWRATGVPPCHLLLLEVSHGLGGGAQDFGIETVLDDLGLDGGPDAYAKSFVRADRLLRRRDESGAD